MFGAFVERVLAPTLRPGQVGVMDNLSAHKVGWIVGTIESAGCRVVFLPPYSPDFSPIEPMGSKVKQLPRKAAARAVEALKTAVGTALAAVTAANCVGWFNDCGHTLHIR